MVPSSFKNISFAFILIMAAGDLSAQTPVAEIKHKQCLLKGRWQLVQTFTDSVFHKVEKTEYNAVVHFKPLHHFTEEVHYEGYHWAIEGKWHVEKHKATLSLTERKYALDKLGDSPKDILFELSELTKSNWTGNSTAEGKPVKMFYKRVKRKG